MLSGDMLSGVLNDAMYKAFEESLKQVLKPLEEQGWAIRVKIDKEKKLVYIIMARSLSDFNIPV